MWVKNWRKEIWKELDQEFDILIVGGGITGAGILRRAVEEGLKVLLVEAGDFASGTSSRSSKLIHGGFRYLRNKQFSVTKESVREREWLLHEARQLVSPLGFIMPCPADRKTAFQFGIGVILYDLLAPKWNHKSLGRKKILQLCPLLEKPELNHGFLYYDAKMDDARMVLRLLQEATIHGGFALNYTRAKTLLRQKDGKVCGAVLQDESHLSLGEREVRARVVINATGPWSDDLRVQVGGASRLRKLRGSHLVFSRSRLNLPHAVTLLHPVDHRAMFAIPWEGVTLIGTTDLDHTYPIHHGEPFTTQQEIEYMLQAANSAFPKAALTRGDIVSTFAGLRPVINSGAADPSRESRAHQVWEEEGLITVTGGKYTTFRIMAEQTLQLAMRALNKPFDLAKRKTYFDPLPRLTTNLQLLSSELDYLSGRYANETRSLLEASPEEDNQPIGSLPNFWSELRWAARTGAVEHLDDLLLRRVRLGLLLPDGAIPEMQRIRSITQSELGWSDVQWQQEVTRYSDIYARAYSASPLGFD